MLRTRLMGGRIFADAHIQVDSDISVSEGHHVAEYVMQQLKTKFPDISDVTAHIDPEDDDVAKPSADLPIREEVLDMLRQHEGSKDLFAQIERVMLHYIDGAIQLEIFLKHATDPMLIDNFRTACGQSGYIRSVQFYCECT